MHIRYVAAPSDCFHNNSMSLVTESKDEVVILVNRDASIEQACTSLTKSVNKHALNSWVHVGPVDWEEVLADQPDVSPQP